MSQAELTNILLAIIGFFGAVAVSILRGMSKKLHSIELNTTAQATALEFHSKTLDRHEHELKELKKAHA